MYYTSEPGQPRWTPNSVNPHAYPAPSGEEDNELWKTTLKSARTIMVTSKESLAGSRMQSPGDDFMTKVSGSVDPTCSKDMVVFSSGR